ncbi:hypothetical protein DPMN_064105 [Dreissena polymorpha]|uniref:Uncharacterized protein n=1 Tax=Dreissena polymorpha TaxID=45954 RepID=A0A9D4CCR1_DREPO|nr:hypothetical protein DPMN_064105 [Dreissena polymorpha]
MMHVIHELYGYACSAVLLNGQQSASSGHQWSSVRDNYCSPALFNLCLEKIMQETTAPISISIDGRPISNIKIAHDIGRMCAKQ